MATPISNNNPSPMANNKGHGRVEHQKDKEQGRAVLPEQASDTAVERQGDAVNVSRAAQALSGQPGERGKGAIKSAEHASEVARAIRAMFEGNAGQALAAQAKNVSSELAGILKAK